MGRGGASALASTAAAREQALYRCRYSRGAGPGRLLAAGGAAGLLRLLSLQMRGSAVAEAEADEEDESE
jgi:hypothetical protein